MQHIKTSPIDPFGNKRGRLRVEYLAVLLLFFLMMARMTWEHHRMMFPSGPDLVEISEISQIEFPKSARVLKSQEGIPFGVYAQIEMDRSDVEGFYKQFTPTKHSDKTVMSTLKKFSQEIDWWKPGSMKKYMTFEKNTSIQGAVSLDDKRHAIVYIMKMPW